jgi:hypothetical protein
MKFYQLTHPEYSTDQQDRFANPIQPVPDIWLPGIICAICGATWAGSRRIYLPITDTRLRQKLHGRPLPEADWYALEREVREQAGVPANVHLYPGDVLGIPRAELLSTEIFDFMHPFPGQLIVTSTVVDTLQRAALSGFKPIQVQLSWGRDVKNPPTSLPVLYELIITGQAWRVNMDESHITACSHCGRTIFPEPEFLVVDERRWDGSDFFHVDHNPNIVLVTERVCNILSEEKFSNYICIPVWGF